MLNPIPLIDGCLFIDNSTMEYLHTCPRSAEYFLLNNRVFAGDKPALNFGGAIHAALETRYHKYGEMVDNECLPAMMDVLEKWFADKPTPQDDHRSLGLAQQVCAGYLQKYSNEEWVTLEAIVDGTTTKFVEFPFSIELGEIADLQPHNNRLFTKIIFCGRIDLAVREGSTVWLVDHKTSSIMGTQIIKEQKMSNQWKGYCWAFHKATGIMPYGTIINGIRVRPPVIAKFDKSGKQTSRNAVEPDDFQRFKLILEDHHIDEWRENTLVILDEFFWNHSRGLLPMKTKWCIGKYGACPYYEVCELPPSSRPAMLSSGLYMDNSWSPLRQQKPTNTKTT